MSLFDSYILTKSFENFAERITAHDVLYRPRREVGPLVRWRISVEKTTHEGIDYLGVNTKISGRWSSYFTAKLYCVECTFSVKNAQRDRWCTVHDIIEAEPNRPFGRERMKRLDTIFEPESGYLRDGALEVRVERRIHGVVGPTGTRSLYLFFRFEDSVKLKWRIGRSWYKRYSSKHLLILHSPVLAQQLAAEIVIYDDDEIENVESASVEIFIQLMHGVKLKVPSELVLGVIYLGHKYQVLSVLRFCELLIYGYNWWEDDFDWSPFHMKWIKRLLSKNHLDDLKKVIPAHSKELADQKRKILLAITRAPFTHNLDSPESEPLPVSNASSIFHNFSKSIRSIIGCL